MSIPRQHFIAVLSLAFAGRSLAVRAGAESRQAADSLSQKIAAITQTRQPRNRPYGPQRHADRGRAEFLVRLSRRRRYLPGRRLHARRSTLLGDGAMRGTATLDLEKLAARRAQRQSARSA